MSEPNEINERVTRLEVEVDRARQDAAAARVLAGGADRDVSGMQAQLRAHTKTLGALRESQLEQGKEMREGFARVEARFAKVEGDTREGFGRAEARFATVEGDMREGFGRVDARFATVEGDMREGFGRVDARFATVESGMREGFGRVEARFATVESEIREGFGRVDGKVAGVNEKLARVDDQFARVDERLVGLETGQQRIIKLLTRDSGECESEEGG